MTHWARSPAPWYGEPQFQDEAAPWVAALGGWFRWVEEAGGRLPHPQTLSYHQTTHYWMSPRLLTERQKKCGKCWTLMFTFSSAPTTYHSRCRLHTHTQVYCCSSNVAAGSSQADAIPVYSAFPFTVWWVLYCTHTVLSERIHTQKYLCPAKSCWSAQTSHPSPIQVTQSKTLQKMVIAP